MELYGGIDLHGNNNVISLLDRHDGVVFEKRIANNMEEISSGSFASLYFIPVSGLCILI